mgnify:CR=1 FL=1
MREFHSTMTNPELYVVPPGTYLLKLSGQCHRLSIQYIHVRDNGIQVSTVCITFACFKESQRQNSLFTPWKFDFSRQEKKILLANFQVSDFFQLSIKVNMIHGFHGLFS